MQSDGKAPTRDEEFINWLMKLADDDQARQVKTGAKNRAVLAALRRGLGKGPGEALELYPYLMQFLAPSEEYLLEYYALIASLFASHPVRGGQGNLGASLAEVRKEAERGGAGAASIERRFVALLNCRREDLPKHLRHVVSLAKSKEVTINWLQLLRDIKYWDRPERSVQRRWAREFWAGYEPAAPDGAINPINEKEDEVS